MQQLKGQIIDKCNKGESQKYNAVGKKPDTKKYMLYNPFLYEVQEQAI